LERRRLKGDGDEREVEKMQISYTRVYDDKKQIVWEALMSLRINFICNCRAWRLYCNMMIPVERVVVLRTARRR